MKRQYFEDIEVGTASIFGAYRVTREEIIDFASRYDPQPFHLSDEAAARTHFGRLAASGWHTTAMMMAMLVEHLNAHQQAGLGSPGVDELRWVKPVYAGDVLSVETMVIEKNRSRSRPEMGSYRLRVRVFNQKDETVMTLTSIGLIACRDAATPANPSG